MDSEDFVLIVEGEMFRWSLLGWSLITIEDLEDDARGNQDQAGLIFFKAGAFVKR